MKISKNKLNNIIKEVAESAYKAEKVAKDEESDQ